jgi:hypothetical protein
LIADELGSQLDRSVQRRSADSRLIGFVRLLPRPSRWRRPRVHAVPPKSLHASVCYLVPSGRCRWPGRACSWADEQVWRCARHGDRPLHDVVSVVLPRICLPGIFACVSILDHSRLLQPLHPHVLVSTAGMRVGGADGSVRCSRDRRVTRLSLATLAAFSGTTTTTRWVAVSVRLAC